MSSTEFHNFISLGPSISLASAPVTLDGTGVHDLTLKSPPCVVLADASTLQGLALMFPDGDPIDLDVGQVVIFEICTPGTATIKHMAAGVSPDSSKLKTETAVDMVIGETPVSARYRHDGSAWGWYVHA